MMRPPSAVADPQIARRRGRWALTFASVAVTLGTGWTFTFGLGLTTAGGPAGRAVMAIGDALGWVGVAFGLLAVLAVVGALTAALRPRRATAAIVVLAVLTAIGMYVAASLSVPDLTPLAVPLVPILLIVAMAIGPHRPRRDRPTRAAVALTIAATTMIVLTLLHIAVWNPMAHVPDLALNEIYREMRAAGQWVGFDGTFWIWTIGGVLIAGAYLVVSLVGPHSERQVVVTGLAVIGMIGATDLFPAFGVGMAVADTFATSGADAALSGPLLAIVGQLALVSALLIGLAPRTRAIEARTFASV